MGGKKRAGWRWEIGVEGGDWGSGGRLGWRGGTGVEGGDWGGGGEEREKEGERCQSRHLELLQDPESQGSLKSVSLASALPTVLLV